MAKRRKTSRWRLWLTRILIVLILGPLFIIASLRWIDPPTSAFILKRQYDLWVAGSPARVQHSWVDSANIAPAMKLAAIAAEDQRFPEHWGFDIGAIADAVRERADNGRVRGASTISQQVAKNLFLWSGRSWLRKGLEAWFTAIVELTLPKRRILEIYLNIAQFGPNTFGVAAASQSIFAVPPAKLSAHQAARLAAVLPNPVQLRADEPSVYLHSRVFWIEGQMVQLGWDYVRDL